MSKYSFEFKKKVAEEYIYGTNGYKHLAKKYGVSSYNNIKHWVIMYRAFGDEGLKAPVKRKNYTFDFKLSMVELYLSSQLSYQEVAVQNGIGNASTLVKWVNDYRIAGPDALKPRMRSCTAQMKMEKKNDTIDTSIERVKALEDELLRLKIENAYLKELRRLRLEEESLQKKQRESYTVSEDSSN